MFLFRIIAFCGRTISMLHPSADQSHVYESGMWVLAMGLSRAYVVGGGYDVVRAEIFY